MSVVDRSHSNSSTVSPAKGGGKKQGKKQAKREAKLMLKVEQARKDMQKSQGKVARAQARLDDDREQLRALEEKLAALRNSEQQNSSDGNMPNDTGTTGQQLPSNETSVGNAFDTELAQTPDQARTDVLEDESQEQEQTDAVARDMVAAEDQGEVSAEPTNQEQASEESQDQGQEQEHGQHSNTFFESRSEPDEQSDQEQEQKQDDYQDNYGG